MKNKISYIVSGNQDVTNMIMVITVYVLCNDIASHRRWYDLAHSGKIIIVKNLVQ